MFMCTKDEESKTKIKVSLMENNVLRNEQGETGPPRNFEVIPLALPSCNPTRVALPSSEGGSSTEHETRKSVNGYTVQQLFRAISEARVADVRHCLHYVSIRTRDPNDGKTPLITAVVASGPERRRLRLMRLLIDRRALVDAVDSVCGRDAIAWAAVTGRLAELAFLLNYLEGDVDFHRVDNNGATYLHLAVLGGSLGAVELLLERMRRLKLSPDTADQLGLTPYITARRLGHADIASALRRHGGASVAKFDELTFRSPREWSILGHQERKERNHRPMAHLEEEESTRSPRVEPIKHNGNHQSPSPAPSGGEASRGALHRCLAIWSEQHLPTWRPTAVSVTVGANARNSPKGKGMPAQRNRLAAPSRRIRMR